MQLMVMVVVILLVLQQHQQIQAAANSITDYVNGSCYPAITTSNSSFNRNRNTVIAAFTQRSSQSYYSQILANSSDLADNTTYVYGVYQCRNDISLDSCSSCVSLAFTYSCPPYTVFGIRIQFRGCYMRYENYNFLTLEDGIVTSNCSADTSSNSIYQTNLANALNLTIAAAPQNSNYFSASNVGTTNSTTAYALAQCLGYLTPNECATCLSQYTSRSTICEDSISGYFYYVSCYYLFDNSSLALSTSISSQSTPSTPPSTPPPISPKLSPSPSISPGQSHDSPSPSPVSAPSGNKRKNVAVTVGITISVISIIAVTVFSLILLFKKKHHKYLSKTIFKTRKTRSDSFPRSLYPLKAAQNFSMQELKEATNGFHSDNKLGQGGFGPVYKGTLKVGKEVAIKILSAQSSQGKEEFMNEVMVITSVQHRNLVQLLGCCMEKSQRILVYEYLPNRSLDLHLFGINRNSSSQTLDWKTRFKIVLGIARGLSYLHEDSHVRIVHRDIKASNILLDNNLNPKIADFGLAKLVQDDVSHVTTILAGTVGYLAPEYVIGGHLSEKADVYSYGLVVLEIVSGRSVINQDNDQHILEWAWSMYERQEQLLMADMRMKEEGIVNEAELARVVQVALLCTQSNPAARPLMSQVYAMLRSKSTISVKPTKPNNIMGVMPSLQTSSISPTSSSDTVAPLSISSSCYPTTHFSYTELTDSITTVCPR